MPSSLLQERKKLYIDAVKHDIYSQRRNPRHTLINPKNTPLDESASVKAADSFNKMLFSIFRITDETSWLSKVLTTIPNSLTHGKISASKLQYGEKGIDIITLLIDDTTAFVVGNAITTDGGATGTLLFKSDRALIIQNTGATQWTPVDTIAGNEIRQLSNGVTNSLFVTGYTKYLEKGDSQYQTRSKNRYSIKIEDSPVQAKSIMVPIDMTIEQFQDFQVDEYLRMNAEMHLGQLQADIVEIEAIKDMKLIAERHSDLDLGGATGAIADTVGFLSHRIFMDIASIRATGDVASKFFTIVSPGVLAGLMLNNEIDISDEFDDTPNIIGRLSSYENCLVILDRYATEEYILTGSQGNLVTPNSGLLYMPISTDIRFTNHPQTLEPIIGLFSIVAFPRNPADSFLEGVNSNFLRYSKVLGLDKIVYGAGTTGGGGGTPPNPTTDIYIGEY